MRIEDTLTDEQMNFLFEFGLLVNLINYWDFMLDQKQVSNDEIMKTLEYQNQEYLERILANQRTILERLDKLEKI